MHGVWNYLEILALGQTSADRVRAGYPLRGWEHVDRAREAGKGLIMVSAHVGAFSSAGQIVGLSGVPTTVLVEQIQPPALHDRLSRLREKFGLRMLVADRSAIRHIMSALRHNECVGMMCDRDVAGTGELLPFFGKETRVTTAAATIALRTGAVVLPVVGYRTGFMTGPAIVTEPVEMPHTGNVADDVREGTLRILARLESFIREHPEQWVVFEDLWRYGTIPRTRPESAPRVRSTTGSEPL